MSFTVSIVRLTGNEREGRARFALLLGALLALAALKLALVGSARGLELLHGVLFDSAALLLCWFVSELLGLRGEGGRTWTFSGTRVRPPIGDPDGGARHRAVDVDAHDLGARTT